MEQILENAIRKEIIDLWHLSKTALANMPQPPKRWHRRQYILRTLQTHNAAMIQGLTKKQLWLKIEEVTNPIN